MAKSFSDLKKNKNERFKELNQKLNDMNQGGYHNPDEDKYWKLTVDENQSGTAKIRFLPAPEGEDIPFVKLYTHGFKGPTGKWYIENCLSTIGKDDPVNEMNSELWATGLDEDRKIVKERKRRLSYIANIYVIEDPAKPENNGKVFLFSFGKKIFDKIEDAMNPEYEDETPVNVFDLWEGATFRLKSRKYEGYRNYDKSSFDDPEPLFDDDEKLEEVWNKEHSLAEIVDEKNFKSYDDLKAKLNTVLGLSSGSSKVRSRAEDDEPKSEDENDTEEFDMSDLGKEEKQKVNTTSTVDDDDDELAAFQKLLNED